MDIWHRLPCLENVSHTSTTSKKCIIKCQTAWVPEGGKCQQKKSQFMKSWKKATFLENGLTFKFKLWLKLQIAIFSRAKGISWWRSWSVGPPLWSISQQMLAGLPWNFVHSFMFPREWGPQYFGDPLMFCLVPPWGILWWMDSHQIWYTLSCPPVMNWNNFGDPATFYVAPSSFYFYHIPINLRCSLC